MASTPGSEPAGLAKGSKESLGRALDRMFCFKYQYYCEYCSYCEVRPWKYHSQRVEVTIPGGNRLGIACEKTSSANGYIYNFPLPIECPGLFRTYSTAFPPQSNTKQRTHPNHMLRNRTLWFSGSEGEMLQPTAPKESHSNAQS